jgi:DNA polymerase III subunit epsilon
VYRTVRQVFLDTETTGLLPEDGHRIIEIGCIEMINRRFTDKRLHLYLNPERQIDVAASDVHGITLDQLQDKPKFAEVIGQITEFLNGAELIIHNAPFDMGFLEHEFALVGQPPLRPQVASVIDTLVMAKQMFPGKRKSLDALCDRFGISNKHRVHHGALLDAGLLAEVYLAMTQGQDSLEIPVEDEQKQIGATSDWPIPVLAAALRPSEIGAHEQALETIKKESKREPVWSRAAVR